LKQETNSFSKKKTCEESLIHSKDIAIERKHL